MTLHWEKTSRQGFIMKSGILKYKISLFLRIFNTYIFCENSESRRVKYKVFLESSSPSLAAEGSGTQSLESRLLP